MPELPEVETIVRAARPRLVGRRIVGFESRWPPQVSPSVAEVQRRVRGRHITRLSRRGKYIIMELGGPTKSGDPAGCLLIHLRMSGRFEFMAGPPNARANRSSEPSHVRAVWRLDDGLRLLFCDARKFGRIEYARDLSGLDAKLGVDACGRSFTAARLARELSRRARQLKPLLLDQSVIAGLGNIYTDEALFRAGLHPLTPSNRIDRNQSAALHRAIRDTLKEGIKRNGASIDWVYPGGEMQSYFRVYGRTGQPCRVCGTPIEYLKVSQRGTHICPRCQHPPDAVQ